MKSRTLMLVLAAVFVVAPSSRVQSISAAASSQSSTGGIPWLEILRRYSSAFGVKFTVESDHRNVKNLSPFDTRMISEVPKVDTLDQLLDAIRLAVPESTVVLDKRNPHIVHIVESSIYRDGTDALNETVTLKFSGTEAGLLNQVESRTDHAIVGQEAKWGSSGGLSGSSADTQISVDVVDFSYRSLLADFMPFGDYGPILWRAVVQVGANRKPIVLVNLGHRPFTPYAPTHISLGELLTKWGTKFELHFTLERDPSSSAGSDLVRIQLDANRLKIATAEDLFATIRASYPAVQISFDQNNPAIVHIVESTLNPVSNVMDRKVSLQFTGTFLSLLQRLCSESHSDLGPDGGPATRPVMQAQMEVKAVEQSYRDVLCDFASLREMPSVLWTADYYRMDSHFIPGKKVEVVVVPGRLEE